jgi:hypothetical protein
MEGKFQEKNGYSRGLFDFVLLLVVLDCGLDGIFGKHGAMELHRWQLQVSSDIRVLCGDIEN